MSITAVGLAVVIAAAVALIPATVARSKGLSFAGWWVLGLLFDPIAIVAVLVVPASLCAYCREPARQGAQICPHCRSTNPTGSAARESEYSSGELAMLYTSAIAACIAVVGAVVTILVV